ncbi:MAG: hypothetical protein JW795_14355 [Chitinivibrionales bacterium]|nr:hypothetical protein [Chitinivibrionales bacterium]
MPAKSSFFNLKNICAVTGLALSSAGFILFLSCTKPTDPPVDDPMFDPVIECSSKEVKDFVSNNGGGPGTKLVFVKKIDQSTKLCYIDFSEQNDTPKVHILSAAKNPAVPMISPDGNWVTYASGAAPEVGKDASNRSSVYIMKLTDDAQPVLVAKDSALEPRFVQNMKGGSKLYIVYPTLPPNEAWKNGIGKTMKVEIDISSTTPVVGEKSILYDKASFVGGISWDENYLCSGGGRAGMINLQTKDTATIDIFEQACNASISSSRVATNTMMYLVTTGHHPKVDNDKAFAKWEIIFISNFKKEICKWYKYPDSSSLKHPVETNPLSFTTARWHHPEWSNHPYFAAATYNVDRYFSVSGGFVNTGYQERIFIINLKGNNQYVEVLRLKNIKYNGIDGDDSGYFWPYLWVEVPTNFTEESGWLNPLVH